MERVIGAALLALTILAPGPTHSWWTANGDRTSTRATTVTSISARTASRLERRWRFRLPHRPHSFGATTANPVVAGDTIYVQDTSSNVYALDRTTGRLRWQHRYVANNDGPNGVAVVGRRLYTETDTTALALDAETGRTLWSHRLVGRFE